MHLPGGVFVSNKNGTVVQRVWKLAKPVTEELGLSLWDVRYVKEGAGWFLRVYIDSPRGVSIEDCEEVSRALDEPLDKADPISQSYTLEVCSPGLERSLTRDEHFEQFIGADIMVKLLRPREGIGKEFKGVLESYKNGDVTVKDHGGENRITINKKDTAYIKLDDFDI